MTKVFRKIRFSMLHVGKFRRYFAYAFGEIVLIIIGVLFALSLNNWNKKRIEQNEQDKIILSINSEFKKNLESLNTTIQQNDELLLSVNKLLLALSDSITNPYKGEKLDEILFEISDFPIWERSDLNIQALQNSQYINRVDNNDLINLVYEWIRMIEKVERYEKKGDYAYQYYIDYIKKNGSWREIDKYMWKETNGSQIHPSNDDLLKEVEFENSLNSLYIWGKHKNNKYKEIKLTVEQIISTTEK